MKFHPLSEILPILPGHELDELGKDIKENGLRIAITTYEGKVLDGRNRYLACKRFKIKPRFKELDSDQNPLLFVVSMNVSRRHLTQSQRAMVVAKLTSDIMGWKPPGRPSGGNNSVSVSEVAKAAGVSKSTAKNAKRLLARSVKKAREVEEGKKTISQAEKEIAREKPNGFRDALGYPIPEPALPYWNRADEVKDILKQISKLKTLAEELQTRKDPMYCEVNLNWARVELGNLYQAFKCAIPYVVCTTCQGRIPESCTLCKGRGVISEFRWEHALPEEARMMRSMAVKKLDK